MSCTSSDLDKTHAKFQNDPAKTVIGVAFTLLGTFCDGQLDSRTDRHTDEQTDAGKNNMTPDLDGGHNK